MLRRTDVDSKNSENLAKEETPLHQQRPKYSKPPACSKNALYHFQSFADNASIDGIKFLGEKGRTIPERVFWFVTLTVALVLCLFLVVKTFQKWVDSPVIVSFAAKQTSVSEIPFPAITICPQVKARKEMVNYTDIYLKLGNNRSVTETEKTQFEFLSLICQTGWELLDKNVTDKESIQFFMQVAPNFNETILDIQWKNVSSENAGKYFWPILTSEGICYTFNALDRKELFSEITSYHEDFFSNGGLSSKWSPETGYANSADIEAFPRRTSTAGTKGGLKIMLRVLREDLDHSCGDFLQGFKVTLHHPAEVPRVRQSFFQLPLDQNVVTSVSPNMMTTSDDLRKYSIQDRQCYFASEKKLKFFKIYHQQNCLSECLANFTLLGCGCVNFHMPREESTPICGPSNIDCMEEANVRFLENDVNYRIKRSRKSKLSKTDTFDKCDCLPACHSLEYDIETSQSNWNWKAVFGVLRQTSMWNKSWDDVVQEERFYASQLTVFFKNMQFLTSERNEWRGYTDFWSDIGGIIGLFTGFSFITMFEIIYYLTLRPGCNIKIFGRHFWSGAPELLNNRENKITPG